MASFFDRMEIFRGYITKNHGLFYSKVFHLCVLITVTPHWYIGAMKLKFVCVLLLRCSSDDIPVYRNRSIHFLAKILGLYRSVGLY